MSFLKSKAVMAVGATVGILYLVPKFSGNSSNVFETPGSKNIADRWSAGGGSTTHTPAAATRRGDPQDTESRAEQSARTGVDSEHFKEHLISQRPGEPGPFDKNWNKAHYGTEKGK
ncbi:uncharacterized protein K452DRAFT_270839 [Aplosporella prunicola CBS 121167]|uniref:Uncharacterized protein n=1 Tax=Aplosporella prunicola CBS 121167 TaxID=1176127 RepID=A0A6A6BEV7_9PEZI|nr:uncharacterized protein K452DRAFT_270839 [Aplosporella prunicola CBS 121167]KAF2142098.1 hypothetical protein K452DRAFT_270839 [Aplosporella prunicola CBS 121167]